MSDLDRQSELHEQSERNRLDLLRADLALCRTFADVVRTKLRMGKLEAAQRVLTKAEAGYAVIARFQPTLENATHKVEIGRELNLLRTTLDNLQGELYATRRPTESRP